MKAEELNELHGLLFCTLGLYHEKFLHRFGKESENYPGIKKNHIRIIGFLYRYPALTATEIAKMLNVEKGSVTTLLDQLEEYSLIDRCECHQDRRKSLVSLTDAGRTEMENIMRDTIRRLDNILADADPAELRDFIKNLRQAAEFMQKL